MCAPGAGAVPIACSTSARRATRASPVSRPTSPSSPICDREPPIARCSSTPIPVTRKYALDAIIPISRPTGCAAVMTLVVKATRAIASAAATG